MKSDLLTGVLFFLAVLLWAVVARHYVRFNRIGVVIIAVPALVLIAVGVIRCVLYLIYRLQKVR